MIVALSLFIGLAYADVVIDKVQVSADKRVEFDVTLNGASIKLVADEMPVTLTHEALQLSVARYGDLITAVTTEDGRDTGQLEIFGPENGTYQRRTPKPITARSANLLGGDVALAVGEAQPEAELNRMAAFYTANPDRPLSAWMRRLERDRLKPAPALPSTVAATKAAVAPARLPLCLATVDEDCAAATAPPPPSTEFQAKRSRAVFK